MSCFCADPCTHSVQDLTRLTCFRNIWNHGIWRSVFVSVRRNQGVLVIWGRGWYFRGTDCLLFFLAPARVRFHWVNT